jgi:SPP1 gp7 family putative phage head morphogenesis protein
MLMAKTAFALNLPPEKAIKWLEDQGVSIQNRREMSPEEAAKVITVARISNLDMMQNIKTALVDSAKNGTPYAQFKKDILSHMQAAGWVHKDENGQPEIIDPDTGEVFGSPRRLENIYRTNMQAAFSASRYQSLMQNTHSRPYWQYSSVNDYRTRPAHAAMSGLVYRYDDPFWDTFYPPNGYRCRCTVTALANRDIQRRGLIISESTAKNLIDSESTSKSGQTHITKAYRAPDGTLVKTDKGFDYHVGKINYRPNLDEYDRKLAQQFAKADMTGAEFKTSLQKLQKEIKQAKKHQGNAEQSAAGKSTGHSMKFAAGMLSDENQQLLQSSRASVWLSDDTLIEQIKNMVGQDVDNFYQELPEVINTPDMIFKGKNNTFSLIRKTKAGRMLAVIRQMGKSKEIYVKSYQAIGDSELEALQKKLQQLK